MSDPHQLSALQVAQKLVDRILNFRAIAIKGLAYLVLLASAFACLLVPIQGAAEALSPPRFEHACHQIQFDNSGMPAEGMRINPVLEKQSAQRLGNSIELFAPVPEEAKAVIEQSPKQNADNRPEGGEPRMGDGQAHDLSYYIHAFLSLSVILLPSTLLGFFLTYPHPLKTREDWLELWRDMKFGLGI